MSNWSEAVAAYEARAREQARSLAGPAGRAVHVRQSRLVAVDCGSCDPAHDCRDACVYLDVQPVAYEILELAFVTGRDLGDESPVAALP